MLCLGFRSDQPGGWIARCRQTLFDHACSGPTNNWRINGFLRSSPLLQVSVVKTGMERTGLVNPFGVQPRLPLPRRKPHLQVNPVSLDKPIAQSGVVSILQGSLDCAAIQTISEPLGNISPDGPAARSNQNPQANGPIYVALNGIRCWGGQDTLPDHGPPSNVTLLVRGRRRSPGTGRARAIRGSGLGLDVLERVLNSFPK